MPREKFKTLTVQMFYVLLCLCEERCGIEILEAVRMMTNDRVKVAPVFTCLFCLYAGQDNPPVHQWSSCVTICTYGFLDFCSSYMCLINCSRCPLA